jgi:4'-phosphopantetheinyl transferase
MNPIQPRTELENEAHIWVAFPAEHSDPLLLATYGGWLSSEEEQRCANLHFFRDQLAFLVGHALLRSALSWYSGVPPAELAFSRNPHGRPELQVPKDLCSIRFNTSRTRGVEVCLIVLAIDAGVDVEKTSRHVEPTEIASHLFSPEEAADLRSLSEAMQRERFYSYWTLKEAYAKALGMGLSLPFNRFGFDLDADGGPRLVTGRQHQDDPRSWQFVQLRPAPSYILSAALRRGYGPDMKIKVFPFKPCFLSMSSYQQT